MTDRISRGLRPHELLGKNADAAAKDKDKDKDQKGLSADANSAVNDVLELAHRQVKEAESVRFKKSDAKAHLSRFDAVAKKDGVLFVAGEQFALKKSLDQNFTLLEPNEKTIAHVARGLASGEATIISAAQGSGASLATRAYLEAIGEPYELVRNTRSTALDALVGSMRPDENKK